MATIRKRGSTWQVQIRREGHDAISRSFPQKSDALVWAREMESRLERGERLPSAAKLKSTAFADLIIRYRDEVVVAKRGAAIERIILNAFLRQPLANQPLSNITAERISQYRDRRLEKVKPATLHRELGLLRHVLKVARTEWSVPIVQNPFDGVRLPTIRNERQRRLRPGELERLHMAMKRLRNVELVGVVHLAIETGMRRGELLAIRAADIDLATSTLHIPVSKNGRARTIPLTVRAKDVLRPRLYNADRPIFSVSGNAVRLAWQRVCGWAEINDLHFHDLRHEAISRFFEKGLSMPEVASISGHRDPRMLFRYAHFQAEQLAKKLAATDSFKASPR